jgi:hypothetical protein
MTKAAKRGRTWMFASAFIWLRDEVELAHRGKYYSNAPLCEDRVDGPARRINHILAGNHFGSGDGGSQNI